MKVQKEIDTKRPVATQTQTILPVTTTNEHEHCKAFHKVLAESGEVIEPEFSTL